jgi:hypothetical protein
MNSRRRVNSTVRHLLDMRVAHSAITSPLYELANTYELDVQLGEGSYSLRIELFRNTETEGHFRCHAWELKSFRLGPTFPMDENGNPTHVCDDVLMVDRGIAQSGTHYHLEDIVASDVNAALGIVVEDLKRFLEHSTLEKAR